MSDRGVIFDMDGVLVNTGEYHRRAWYVMTEKEGLKMTDELFYGTFGMQNHEIIPMMEPGISDSEIERLSDYKEARYREIVADELSLLPGVRELVSSLKDGGFLLAIGTSTPRVNLDFMLERIHIRPLFDDFVTGEDVERSKPAPDTFALAGEKLGLSPSRCIVVEDAVQGVQSGQSAGMKVVAVTTTRSREDLAAADLIVDSLEELSPADFEGLLQGAEGSR